MSSIVDQAEALLRAVAEPDADPRPDECLLCYVRRRLRSRPCDHHRWWTTRFRDLRSPTATALEHRLLAQGVHCDCGLFERYGWRPGGALLRRDLVSTRGPSDDLPACDGVHRTSTRPCAIWERRPQREEWPPPEPPAETTPPF
jgi:hypothetical protein